MIFRYADPVRDAEAYYTAQTAAQEQWERENYKGKCPYCGKPMFDGAYDRAENWVYDEEIDDYSHEWCMILAQEDREEETCTA